ncbi:hypothetical protein GCM10023322_23070 [Rugosimonospora acidiphila]|uniref:Uncharacterized protein n=1 Tax=Rugosimonospora acidiphila TaxID=556531 RepID=A0ABP9RQ96_9ACTN
MSATPTKASADTECYVHTAGPNSNYILNCTYEFGLGVMHLKDNAYTHGTYDAALPGEGAATDTYFGWQNAAGWYNGPGYCTSQARSDDGGRTWRWQEPDLGPGQHFIGGATDYQVFSYKC